MHGSLIYNLYGVTETIGSSPSKIDVATVNEIHVSAPLPASEHCSEVLLLHCRMPASNLGVHAANILWYS